MREGKQLIVDATCKGARTSAATTHAVITGTFDSAYKIESKSTYDPPVRGKSEGAALIEAKWTGACKPGQKPGDVMLPSGAKLRSAGTDKNASDKAGAAATQTPRQSEKRKGGGAYVPPPPTTK